MIKHKTCEKETVKRYITTKESRVKRTSYFDRFMTRFIKMDVATMFSTPNRQKATTKKNRLVNHRVQPPNHHSALSMMSLPLTSSPRINLF